MNSSMTVMKYRDSRKRIVNRLGKYSPASVIHTLVTELRSHEPSDIERYRSRPPWRTLLLLRWFLERGHYAPRRPRPMTQPDLAKLIHATGELETVLELPSAHPTLTIFLRKIAHQQFWFQENLQVAHFTRQSLLFRELPPDHPLVKQFRDIVGAEPRDFVPVLAALTIHLAVNQVTVERSFFDPLETYFARSTIDAVLGALSKDRDELRTYLRASQFEETRSPYEYHARTPLTRYPLLRIENRYIPYCSAVLARGAETLVYDILREADPSAFMNHFGPLFEVYVRKGVEHIGATFKDEQELKRTYDSGKVVDFAFTSGDGTLLIDAKFPGPTTSRIPGEGDRGGS